VGGRAQTTRGNGWSGLIRSWYARESKGRVAWPVESVHLGYKQNWIPTRRPWRRHWKRVHVAELGATGRGRSGFSWRLRGSRFTSTRKVNLPAFKYPDPPKRRVPGDFPGGQFARVRDWRKVARWAKRPLGSDELSQVSSPVFRNYLHRGTTLTHSTTSCQLPLPPTTSMIVKGACLACR
jgi:hypothetical protein